MRHLIVLAFFISACLMSIPTVKAEEAALPDIPKPLKVLPSKIKPVQDGADEMSKAAPATKEESTEADSAVLETLIPRENAGFKPDFWKNSSRDDLVVFLTRKGSTSPSRSVRNLTLQATLTPAPHISPSDVPAENLYSLRLAKLVELGAFEDALTLYKMNEAAPPTPLAARAGIEAMLGHGETAVACLEQKALDKTLRVDTPEFWGNIDLFCQALIGPVASGDKDSRLANASRIYLEARKVVAPTTANDLNSLDIISTMALAKTGGLSGLLADFESANALPDKQLAVLMSFLPANTHSLPVFATALRRGIARGSDVSSKLELVSLTDNTDGYALFLKEYLKEKPPVLTAQLIDLADNQTKKLLLLPFYSAEPSNFPESNKRLSLELLAITNHELPSPLVRSAFNLPESTPVKTEFPAESGEEILVSYLEDIAKTSQDEKIKATYPVLLALKGGLIPQSDENTAYDNILNLTGKSNYVMPNVELLSSLKKSAEKKQIDQVLFKSLGILADTPLDKIHPAVLYRILEALNSAGLSDQTMSLSRDVLGTILEK